MNYSITLIESDEGWAVWCDDLPGCCSQGDTREEALGNIREAIRDYITVKEDMSQLPDVRRVVRESVCV